jgi:hypothetical protein
MAGVMPGNYRMEASIQNEIRPYAWSVKSALLDGRDAAELPVEIRLGDSISNAVVTLTDRTADLTGVVRDASGAPTSAYVLAVFSTDSRYWISGSRRRVGPIRPDASGRFTVRRLPAGEYFLAAATSLDDVDLYDESVLNELASHATRVTLTDGEKKIQDIKIGG